MNMTQIALIGVGHIHTPGFVRKLASRDDVAVKYVWDHDNDRATKSAEELSGAEVTDVATILGDDAVEAVVICSETNRHNELVHAAAEAGKDMFVEKPLAADATSSHAMARAIREAGVLFQTGYFMRGDPAMLFVKQQIEAGAFGRISRVMHNNCHHGSIGRWFDTDWRWMADPAQAGTGAFGDLGTHSLDVLLWWMGKVDRCTAHTQVVLGNYGECDENGAGLLAFSSGALGTIHAGWVSVANPVRFEVSGTEGHALHVHGNLYFQSEHVDGADGKQPWTNLPEARPHAFDNFLDAVTGKDHAPLVDVDEAAYCASVMDAMYRGAEAGRWIEPE